jgi:signal transduction histidine kinase/CheY-like chemotaxis protein
MHFVLKSFKVGNGLGVIATDITERKRAEQERRRLEAQIQHAQKLESLGVLAGGIAHDFNNLLVAVLGNASLACMNLPPDSPALAQLKDVEAAARRASDLCYQLLAYSGRGTFVIEPIDLRQLIEEMVGLMRVSVSKKAELRLELADRPLVIDADATQLRQVVLNLVVNASEAIGDSVGTITITTGAIEVKRGGLGDAYLAGDAAQGPYAYFEVADTGVGIDPETQRRLFDPFFTTKFAGRGLGLSAVLGIVRGHRGAIKVTSAPGCGTAFRVLLPLLTDATAQQPAKRPPAVAERWCGSGPVLIVDDEPGVRSFAEGVLERLGFTPLARADGRSGLKAFREHAQELKLVLLDLTMPQLGGKEVLAEIRRVRADLPVILMSGYGEADAAEPLTARQVQGFLQKPFDVAGLTAAVRMALEPGAE